MPETDWWDRLYDPEAADTAAADVDVEVEPDVDPGEMPAPDVEVEPRRRRVSADWAPRLASWGADRHQLGMTLNPRARQLLYNGTAAGLGWLFSLPQGIESAISSCGHDAGLGPALIVGAAICAAARLLVDRRTRGWWPPLAWVCRAPLASAVLALLLYAPGTSV